MENSSVEDRVVLSATILPNVPYTFIGDLSPDCNLITVFDQTISFDGATENINGTFTVGSSYLTGTLNFSTSGFCSYNLDKR